MTHKPNTRITIPDYWSGKPIKGSIERALAEEKQEEKEVVQPGQLRGFIYVPSSNIYIAKQRTHLGLNWYQTHEALQKEELKMLTISEFISFLNYLRTDYRKVNKEEADSILDDILKIGEWRGEWLDAKFKEKGNKLYINYNHKLSNGKLTPLNSEQLESCLMENCYADIFDPNSQGLPNKKLGNSYQKLTNANFWHPVKDKVARFVADSVDADLSCDWGPELADASLGVRSCVPKARHI